MRMVLEEPADSDIFLSTWLQDYLGSTAPADSTLTKPAYPNVQGLDAAAEFDEYSATFSQPSLDGEASMALDPSSERADEDRKREVKTARDVRMAANNRKTQQRYRERERERKAALQAQVADLTSRLAGLTSDRANLATRNNLLEKVIVLKDEKIQSLERQPSDIAVPAEQAALGSVLRDFCNIVNGEEHEGMDIPMSKIYSTHKAFIDLLADCLMRGGEVCPSPAHDRLCELISAQRKMQASMGVLSGTLYMTVFSQRVVPWGGGPDDEGPDAQHWIKVLAAAQLTDDEAQAALAARKDILSLLSTIVAERQSIVQAFEVCSKGQDLVKQRERHRLLERLQDNLKLEYRAVIEFDGILFQKVLKPVQQAKMHVASYPWSLNTMAICEVVAADNEAAVSFQHVMDPLHGRSALGRIAAQSGAGT